MLVLKSPFSYTLSITLSDKNKKSKKKKKLKSEKILRINFRLSSFLESPWLYEIIRDRETVSDREKQDQRELCTVFGNNSSSTDISYWPHFYKIHNFE